MNHCMESDSQEEVEWRASLLKHNSDSVTFIKRFPTVCLSLRVNTSLHPSVKYSVVGVALFHSMLLADGAATLPSNT